MSVDKIIVATVGVLGMIFVYWFFLLKKVKEVAVADNVEIIVNGGYSPEVISIPKGKATKITFIRHDSNSCLEEVVLGDFKIRKQLPLNKPVTIEVIPHKAGEFGYSCGMGMFHGRIIVK